MHIYVCILIWWCTCLPNLPEPVSSVGDTDIPQHLEQMVELLCEEDSRSDINSLGTMVSVWGTGLGRMSELASRITYPHELLLPSHLSLLPSHPYPCLPAPPLLLFWPLSLSPLIPLPSPHLNFPPPLSLSFPGTLSGVSPKT